MLRNLPYNPNILLKRGRSLIIGYFNNKLAIVVSLILSVYEVKRCCPVSEAISCSENEKNAFSFS